MNINLLIIEDDLLFIDALKGIVNSLGGAIFITVAQSKESALASIRDKFFDLIILDLSIPTTDGALDGSPVHGHAVFATARVESFGTPILVLTGSASEEFIPSLLQLSEKDDLWGCGTPLPMVAFTPKHMLDRFPTSLNEYISNLKLLSTIELARNSVDISDQEERLIRIFAKRSGGARVTTSLVSGGLSGSKVLRLRVTATDGVLIYNSICKIGSRDTIEDESTKFDKYVNRLLPQASPRKLAILQNGAKNTCGIFYSLAEGFDHNIFGRLSVSEDISSLVAKLDNYLARWVASGEQPTKIRKVRERLLTQEKYSEIVQILPSWTIDFEEHIIQVKWGCAHGDLHGLNVLVSESNDPILIDYGDVGDGPSTIDPVTLELSLFFHPEGPLRNSDWPTSAQARQWWNDFVYLENCPCEHFIRACRTWAKKISAGEREIIAVAYSYLLRQLRYEGVNKIRVLDLLAGVKACYEQT